MRDKQHSTARRDTGGSAPLFRSQSSSTRVWSDEFDDGLQGCALIVIVVTIVLCRGRG